MEIRKTELLGWLPVLADAARTAGQAIMQVYATDFAVRGKADASPVTHSPAPRNSSAATASSRSISP